MDEELKKAQQLAIRDLNIQEPGVEYSDIDKLVDWLTGEIKLLMDHDFERLLHVLYRIDVGEDKTKQALAKSNPARQIATLIMERELQKVVTREKYKEDTDQSNWGE